MDEIKNKIEIIREAIKAYDSGELSDFSTFVAIQMTVNKCEPSIEAIKWAENKAVLA